MLIESPPIAGRLVSFRLADIDLETRRRAALKLCAKEAEDGGLAALTRSVDIMQAALCPSETVYWIPEDVWAARMA